MKWEKNGNNYWSQKNIFFASTATGHHPMAPVETVRFSLQKKNVHLLHFTSRSVSCWAWLKEQSEAQTKQDWTLHRQAPHTPEWWCWSCTTEPTAPVTFNSELSQYRARAAVGLWKGITDKPECLELLLGNSRGLKMAPPYREAEEQLCLRPQWDKTSPAQNQARGLDNNCSQGHPEKNTPWAHTGCWKPCGNAISLLGLQGHQGAPDVKNIQRCEWQWGKINAESNSKDLINWVAIKPERFSLGKHQLPVISPQDKLSSHLAKDKKGLLRSPLLSRKLNSSPVGPAVWVVGTFSATKALTPRESTQCEKATLKERGKWQFYCQISSSLRGKWSVLSELLHSRQNFPCLHLRWRRIGENRENSSLLPIYKWERLRSNAENITLRLLQRSLHLE